jgi:hypothetical protein
MTDDTEDVSKLIDSYFAEMTRVLKSGGRYICVSLLQSHILQKLLDYFPKNQFAFRIVRCTEAEQKNENGMPVFACVATKFKKLPMTIIELCLSGDKPIRTSETDLVESVNAVQKASMVCNGLARGSINEEVSLELYQQENPVPRYTVYILEQSPKKGNGKFAAFIVPQGREIEWLFSTKQGREKLLASAGHDRLAVVSMSRGHAYTDMEAIKDEIGSCIKSLAPTGLKGNVSNNLSVLC